MCLSPEVSTLEKLDDAQRKYITVAREIPLESIARIGSEAQMEVVGGANSQRVPGFQRRLHTVYSSSFLFLPLQALFGLEGFEEV